MYNKMVSVFYYNVCQNACKFNCESLFRIFAIAFMCYYCLFILIALQFRWAFVSMFFISTEVFSQTCEYDDVAFRTITCYNITKSYFFDTGLIVSKYRYRMLKCVNCNIGDIPGYMFNIRDSTNTTSSFLSIDLSSSNITSLDLYCFAGQGYLKKLELRSNRIRQLLPGTFFELNGLEHLDLSSNTIHLLAARSFEGLVHLVKLNLEGNKIVSVQKTAFQDLENLQVLNLSYNLLTTLFAYIFHGLLSLENLLLGYNKIIFIDSGIFDNLTYLENLNLERNSISKLPRDLLFLSKKMSVLNLSFNPLDSKVFINITSDSLEELLVENCSISQVIVQTFHNVPSLRNLDMAKNRLTKFDLKDFSEAATLQTLNLSYNYINWVNLSMGKTRSLQKLDLSFNNIVDFRYQDVYKSMPNIKYINLKNNSLSRNFTTELQEFFKFDGIKIDVGQSSKSILRIKTPNKKNLEVERNNSASYEYKWYMLFLLIFIVILLLSITLYYLYKTNINIINVGNIVNSSSVPLL